MLKTSNLYEPKNPRKRSHYKELGVCPDCEEVYEAKEDYWGWLPALVHLQITLKALKYPFHMIN